MAAFASRGYTLVIKHAAGETGGVVAHTAIFRSGYVIR